MYQGHLLEGRFELRSCLGEGGAGTVWFAHDTHLQIPVAVKILHSALRRDCARRAEFLRESQVCARMLSPHIVRVLSQGVGADDMPYIVYELLEGETLDERLQWGALTLDDTLTVVSHVARALGRAHSMGIVHKDIKPGNIFLTRDDRKRTLVKVLDFGIAEPAGHTDDPERDLMGTLEYMPFEVLVSGAAANEKADLFALAAVAYECLAAQVPFQGESIGLVISQLLAPPLSLEGLLPPAVARPLDAWFLRGLSSSPDERFSSARELADTFAAAVRSAKRALGIGPRAVTSLPVSAPLSSRSSGAMAAPKVPSITTADTVPPPTPDADPGLFDESCLRLTARGLDELAANPTRKLSHKR